MNNSVEFKHLEGAHTVIASSDNSKDSEKFMQNRRKNKQRAFKKRLEN